MMRGLKRFAMVFMLLNLPVLLLAEEVSNTITFSTNAKTTLESNMATVSVTVNATVTTDPQQAQLAIMKQLQSHAPEIQWHIMSTQQEQAASGAYDLSLKLWAQVPQAVLVPLQQHLDQPSKGVKFDLTVMNYDPPAIAVQRANAKLMIQMYQQIQTYVTEFNQATGQSYMIQSVRFSPMTTQPVRALSLLTTSSQPVTAAKAKPMPVTKAIQLNAFVTLSQPSPKSPAVSSATPAPGRVLPPAYLKVKQFKRCLGQSNQGTWQAWCLPSKRPQACPTSSWQQLNQSPYNDGLTACSE